MIWCFGGVGKPSQGGNLAAHGPPHRQARAPCPSHIPGGLESLLKMVQNCWAPPRQLPCPRGARQLFGPGDALPPALSTPAAGRLAGAPHEACPAATGCAWPARRRGWGGGGGRASGPLSPPHPNSRPASRMRRHAPDPNSQARPEFFGLLFIPHLPLSHWPSLDSLRCRGNHLRFSLEVFLEASCGGVGAGGSGTMSGFCRCMVDRAWNTLQTLLSCNEAAVVGGLEHLF